LVIVTTGSGVTAFGATSGRVVWTKALQEDFFASPLGIDVNGDKVTDVVVTARNGNVYALEGLTGDEIWKTNIGAGVRASPTSFDVNNDGVRDLIFADENGRLMIFDTSWGRSILEYQASDNSYLASPVMGDLTNDGLLEIVLVSEVGEISAVGLNRIVGEGKAEWPIFLGTQSHSAPSK
jgi:outer membrane protein assembly factor BamB